MRPFNYLLGLAIVTLGSLAMPALLASTTSGIATINSSTTDGTTSTAVFDVLVSSDQLANELTTSSLIELNLDLIPESPHVGLMADVFAVIVANDKFFKLNQIGSFEPWDGTVANLSPFVIDQVLGSKSQFNIQTGKMAEKGSYFYFFAYGIKGESRLYFTAEPAQLNIVESDSADEESNSIAERTFEEEIETGIVQSLCITCHVEGGLARSSSLLFQRSNIASALNNFNTLNEFIEKSGADKLLSKVAGGDGHVGGVQLAKDSKGYASVVKLIAEIEQQTKFTTYAFNSSNTQEIEAGPRFLSSVVMEPRQTTLRRATLLLQGRIPTDREKNSVKTDKDLRTALRGLMTGENFREFIVNGVNNSLLIKGADGPLALNSPNLYKAYTQRVKYELDEDTANDGFFWNEIQKPARRAAGELVAYIVENEKPYSEILTADYTMMNPAMNEWLEGTAEFSEKDGRENFKPSRLSGFYRTDSLRLIEERAQSRSIYEIVRAPQKDYPHIGILSDTGFLARYPTTATNRNRARARWTFYHFLGVDIEKSSQRPTDEAALSDRNNPTMNNPSCAVCHALLDPVAGAFQNWGQYNMYRDGGHDALDHFYKYPEDGSESPYEFGDLWYRDMRKPGLFDKLIQEEDVTLRKLAEMIVEEPEFLTASAKFWWDSVFGKPMVNKPAVDSDQGYAAKYAAYQAQQDALNEFGDALKVRMNAKDMFVEMFMSPWFGSETATSYTFTSAQNVAEFGNKQLLSPEQLERKSRSLTGVAWRSSYGESSGDYYSNYDKFAVLLGGIDSVSVTSRSTVVTPLMTTILMTHATEVACPAVVRQFEMPEGQRSLFTKVNEDTLPLVYGSSLISVSPKNFGDWETTSLLAEVAAGPTRISIEYANPWCTFGCKEQRILYIDSLSLTSPSGKITRIDGDDERLFSTIVNGNQSCSKGNGHSECYNGGVNLDLQLSESGTYTVEASLSSQRPSSNPEVLQAKITIQANTDPLTANTRSSSKIRHQIRELYQALHGSDYPIDSSQVEKVYEIFVAALFRGEEQPDSIFYECNLGRDGLFFDDNLSQEELASFRTSKPGQEWYSEDWLAKAFFEDWFKYDPYGTKYAWTTVMAYMLSHFDYLHE